MACRAVPLDLGGVGLLAATLDDQPAAIGRAADGQLNVLVSGLGRHRLTLDTVAPLEMTAAQQQLRFRLPNAAVGKWHMTVPGDVEIKSGVNVVSREHDAKANSPASNCCRGSRLRVAATPRSACRSTATCSKRAGGRVAVRRLRRNDRGLRAAPCHGDVLDLATGSRSL